jgi:hypothetical protein
MRCWTLKAMHSNANWHWRSVERQIGLGLWDEDQFLSPRIQIVIHCSFVLQNGSHQLSISMALNAFDRIQSIKQYWISCVINFGKYLGGFDLKYSSFCHHFSSMDEYHIMPLNSNLVSLINEWHLTEIYNIFLIQ